jgi:hypothetical protein
MATLLVTVLLLGGATLTMGWAQASALQDAAELQGERARTEIGITRITSGDSGGGTNVTVQVKNRGATTFGNRPSMDVMVRYTSYLDQLEVKRLTYTSGTPGDNQWTVSSISPDVFNPDLWDPEETATLSLRVVPKVKSGTTATVVVATPNGVSASRSF